MSCVAELGLRIDQRALAIESVTQCPVSLFRGLTNEPGYFVTTTDDRPRPFPSPDPALLSRG